MSPPERANRSPKTREGPRREPSLPSPDPVVRGLEVARQHVMRRLRRDLGGVLDRRAEWMPPQTRALPTSYSRSLARLKVRSPSPVRLGTVKSISGVPMKLATTRHAAGVRLDFALGYSAWFGVPGSNVLQPGLRSAGEGYSSGRGDDGPRCAAASRRAKAVDREIELRPSTSLDVSRWESLSRLPSLLTSCVVLLRTLLHGGLGDEVVL